MRKSLFLIAIAFLGNISGIKSQDMLSRQAPMDKQTSPTAAIQSDKKSVSNTEARTTATKKEPHLLFMGVPIDGSIEMFDQKILRQLFVGTLSYVFDFEAHFLVKLRSLKGICRQIDVLVALTLELLLDSSDQCRPDALAPVFLHHNEVCDMDLFVIRVTDKDSHQRIIFLRNKAEIVVINAYVIFPGVSGELPVDQFAQIVLI